MIAAVVGGTPITVDQVERRVQLLRRGARGDLLPAAGTTEGRQLRRWVAQILVAERVVADEAAARGLVAHGDPPLKLDATARLELGSVMAAVLSGDPLAQALYRDLTAGVTADEAEVRRYFTANQDRYRLRPARLVTHWHDDRLVNGGRWYVVSAGELADQVERAVFAAPEGTRVGPIDGHTFTTGPFQAREVTFEQAAPGIRASLLAARRRRHFALWADARCARAILLPGFEHPGDIRHPDHTHRH
jgi:[acyl-carrier-protein] S-malonyltransferase